ncbi:trypsin-like serine protease [Streptomyces sp. S1A1-8]|uniref:S1C family serine protease n=1 Tax=unclassified Streptomyces TaxID=2593676 RepID=UPI001162F96F|nr:MULTISPECIES: trypsin-like peptidase domain-containing protein [unclassified Streptomyces]QDN99259.1 trypsin-like serine protease [Streptomyces sp. RLB1-9]QDO20974.1 trypsin-like serine protease [Streptomyces sp. S1A1-8]QDO31099.1 trypsin-like serine protease [Streptomyces sp. S1A1-3]
MTESFRRSGEYPQGDDHQATDPMRAAYPQQQPVSSSPVNPEWPPPAYEPVAPVAVDPSTTVWPGSGRGGDGGAGGHGAGGAYAGYPEPDAVSSTAVLQAQPVPAAPAPAPKKRAKGTIVLLAAVAIVAAAIGGGTAYGIQELTGKDTASSSTSTTVVAAAKKGTVAGVAQAVSPSIVEVSATSNAGSSTGSGVIISSSGEIVTNNHVISGASEIKVRLSSGKSYTAKVVGTDSKKDLALIKLENAPSGLKVATLGNSDGVQVGDDVVAIGSPEGLTGTVTSGIVSALNRDVTVSTDESQGQQQQQGGGSGQWPFSFGGQQFNGDTGSSTTTYKAIQTDASLNPGNSGGALIDMNGNIVGINSAMYSAANSSSSSSSAGSVGLGFAIPINTVKSDLASLRAGGSDS